MMNSLLSKEEILYVINLSTFKRITIVSLTCCALLTLYLGNRHAAYLLTFVATAFTLCWYVIWRSTKKIDVHKSTIIYESTRDQN